MVQDTSVFNAFFLMKCSTEMPRRKVFDYRYQSKRKSIKKRYL